MDFIIQGAGVFIYPLGLCSVIALFVVIERLISLRSGKIVPDALASALLAGGNPAADNKSALGRIINFFNETSPNAEELKAFARLEMTRLERGMFLLDAAIAAAPLLGLLGTVAGLVSVFSTENMPTQEMITHGVGLALSTTILGLSIAIPSILGNLYLSRKIDTLCAKLDICAEHLASRAEKF